MGRELFERKAHELRDALRAGETTSTAIVQSCLDRIDAVEPKIQAFLQVHREQALEQADAVDRRFKAGDELDALAGIPIGLKDVLCVSAGTTTCGSQILEDFQSPYEATAVKRLREAGAVIMGKLNMDEFAMGSSTENSAYHVTKNPWDTTRVPGGSSGGSAAAVAAQELPLALGSDTGGSVRQPAAFCGVFGLKPTYGRVSRFGLVAYASSLDQIGPFARDAEDIALLLNAIAGHDPLDATSADVPVPDYAAALQQDVSGLTVGVPKEYFTKELDASIRGPVEQGIAALEAQGARVKQVSLPHSKYTIATYYIIATAEASANLARFDGVRYGYRDSAAKDVKEMYALSKSKGFGAEVQRRILLGTYALSSGYYDAYYLKAQKVRMLIRRDFDAAFAECDVIATPVTPSAAFRIGEKTDDPLEMYLADIYTTSINLAGIPGLAMPCGKTPDGLPVGIQLLAKPFGEETLLRAARALEREETLAVGVAEI